MTCLFHHRIPFLNPVLIPENVVGFREQKEKNYNNIDDQQISIPPSVQRRVISSIDEICGNIPELNRHWRYVSDVQIRRGQGGAPS